MLVVRRWCTGRRISQQEKRVKRISPVLTVHDIDATIAFYRDVLGFPEASAVRGPDGKPVHGMARSGAVALGFAPAGDCPHCVPPWGNGVELYIEVEGDIDQYRDTVVRAGASVVTDLQTQFWGDRTFTIADPNGYHLTFYQTVRTVSMEEIQQALASS
jgi:PhnB protein